MNTSQSCRDGECQQCVGRVQVPAGVSLSIPWQPCEHSCHASQEQLHSTVEESPKRGSELEADPTFDLIVHLRRQQQWSHRTFGPGQRTQGVLDHIRKELLEIEAKPHDLTEWIDLVLLALDGAWRAGHSPDRIAIALEAKQTKNEGRTWPDWRTQSPNRAIEHVRRERL